MQDGARDGDRAGEWLREHFKDDPAPGISITWDVSEEPDDAAYHSLLKLLFLPQTDSPAA
ncbi:hypothetical protein OG949_33055 [Streptomyces scopuliridis]|uniref:hypothetical protein n=1 Tax=Streptomyces scopuliridis TaxID=452529 RepID=UPI002DD8571F|nr:hypothetical protein [Streptomyces scopuliridis]WSB37198.1 hypothetical protein OG949_33055 [Streptomyces scopuliridis]